MNDEGELDIDADDVVAQPIDRIYSLVITVLVIIVIAVLVRLPGYRRC